jgi:hypothetical protein
MVWLILLRLGMCMCCVGDQGSIHTKNEMKITLITIYLTLKLCQCAAFISCSSLASCVDTIDP